MNERDKQVLKNMFLKYSEVVLVISPYVDASHNRIYDLLYHFMRLENMGVLQVRNNHMHVERIEQVGEGGVGEFYTPPGSDVWHFSLTPWGERILGLSVETKGRRYKTLICDRVDLKSDMHEAADV